jgi:hypothetical protein
MATWYLLNEVIIGANPAGAVIKHFPGEFVDDTKVSTANIVAAGGILWPATDPIVAAAAALTNGLLKLRGQGQSAKLSEQLLASALYSLMGGPNGQLLGPAVAAGVAGQIGGLVQKASLNLGFAAINGVAGTSTTVNVVAGGPPATTPALPANSRIIGREIRIATAFSGGAISAMTLSLGITGTTTQIVNAQTVFTGTTGNLAGTSGTDPQPFYAASTQLIATITSTGANLTALTAGALVLDVLYVVLP